MDLKIPKSVIYRLNVQTRVFECITPSSEEILGFQSKEIINMGYTGFMKRVHPYDRPRLRMHFENLARCSEKDNSDFQIQFRWKRKDGKYSWLDDSCILVRSECGNLIAAIGAIRNVTAEVEVFNELEAIKEYTKNLIDSSLDMIISIDKKNRVVEFNRAAQEAFGYTKEEIIGKDVSTLFNNDLEIKEGIQRKRIFKGEVQGKNKNGKAFGLYLSVTPLRDSRRRIIGKVIISRDNSDIKKSQKEKEILEAHLRNQQRMESIGTLASGVAHEINNPLTGIINYAQIIKDKVSESNIKVFADGIVEEGERVSKIVHNLLSFARQDIEICSPVHIKEIIESCISLIGTTLRKDQINLELKIPDDIPQINCRGYQIKQVIMNLLTNSRDALNQRYQGYHENKSILIEVKTIEAEGEKLLRTTIEDHGVGIPDKIVDRIFDPFFTTKLRSEGTGLGLSVSYGIVKEHHGNLTVESKPMDYTRFHVDLPIDNFYLGYDRKSFSSESSVGE